jgi:hypothetical protein
MKLKDLKDHVVKEDGDAGAIGAVDGIDSNGEVAMAKPNKLLKKYLFKRVPPQMNPYLKKK